MVVGNIYASLVSFNHTNGCVDENANQEESDHLSSYQILPIMSTLVLAVLSGGLPIRSLVRNRLYAFFSIIIDTAVFQVGAPVCKEKRLREFYNFNHKSPVGLSDLAPSDVSEVTRPQTSKRMGTNI